MKKAQRLGTAAVGARPNIPAFNFRRLGIVSRDYHHTFPNNRRDFSYSLPSVLRLLDEEGCDAVVFSMYSIIPRKGFSVANKLEGLNSIRAVFIEEYKDGPKRAWLRNVVYFRKATRWRSFEIHQKFGALGRLPKDVAPRFVAEEMPGRLMGGCCVILCGEINGLKYSRKSKSVEDAFGLMAAIPANVRLAINPVHDRMTRFEMRLKRRFLSKGRWVVSVWNKGKVHSDGKMRDGDRPAWDVYYDGEPRNDAVKAVHNELNLEIGLLDLRK